jgi:Flp pilus assembly protein TadB
MKEILQTLADRVSRKAILLMTAMILIYMIVVTPTVVHAIAAIVVIAILSIIGVLLQFVIDCKRSKNKKKIKNEEGKD